MAESTIARRSLPVPGESTRLRDAMWALLASRLIVWIAGVPAVLAVGYSDWREHADPTNLTGSLGSVGHVVWAPTMRWDSIYYMQIAQDGYTVKKQAGFFPLYPLVVGAVDTVVGSTVVAGVIVSLAAFLGALVLLGRLAELEIDTVVARRTVFLVALFPAAVFFSAVYTESLFLLLTVGAFYAARQGRWVWAGILGMLAAATRNVGVVMLVPLVLLYLYGPREDRPGERGRFPVRTDALWLALVPVGLAAVAFAMWRTFDDPFTAWTSQQTYFHRSFQGPFSGIVLGLWKSLSDLMSGLFASAVNKGSIFVVCTAALGLAVASFRRLPVAYGTYAILALAPALSTPASVGPLNGAIRYVAVDFPVFIYLAMVLKGHRRLEIAVYVVFGIGLAYLSARFATWRWVA